MARIQAIRLLEVPPEQDDREPKRNLRRTGRSAREIKLPKRAYQAVVQCVHDPEPESGFCEEHVLLTQGVELRVPIQNTRGDELVKDPDDERGKDGEHDIV